MFHTNGTGTQRQGKIQILLSSDYISSSTLHGECLCIVYKNKVFLLLFKFIYSDSNLVKQDFQKVLRNSDFNYENVSDLSQAENPQSQNSF